jgi:hypothetical protein
VEQRPAQRLAALIVLGLISGSSFAQHRAELPELHIGDTWVYQSSDVRTGDKRNPSTHRLISVTPDTIVLQAGATTRTYTREFNLTDVKRGDIVTETYSPAWQYYSFPLEVGKQWSSDFTSVTRERKRRTRFQWTARVEAIEKITVPAGTFDTFKIRYTGNYQTSDGASSWTGQRIETIWYAPAVKRHVKSEFDIRSFTYYVYHDQRRVELLSFRPGASESDKLPSQ